jgi:ribosome modulation factor
MLADMLRQGDLAFNRGCDTRIAGKSQRYNPYCSVTQGWLRQLWKAGWDEAHENWGKYVQGPVVPLPPVAKDKNFRRQPVE